MNIYNFKIKNIGKVVTGFTPSTKNEEYYSKKEFMFIGPADIKNVKYINKTSKNISAKVYQDYKTRFIGEKSLVIDCIGSDMGNVAIATDCCLTNQQINAICNIDESKFNIEYIYYVLSTMKKYFHLIGNNGSTMPIISKSLFENIEIKVPSKNIQDKISNILCSIDYKIEKNNEINNNLLLVT